MTNPFADITDPAILLAMVQDGVKCEECEGIDRNHFLQCKSCSGTGHTPLPNADLNALAACWCENMRELEPCLGAPPNWARDEEDGSISFQPLPAYTTSPEAAMRLQVQYNVEPVHLGKIWCAHVWVKHQLITTRSGYTQDSEKVEALCYAITTAALIAKLTEAIQGENS